MPTKRLEKGEIGYISEFALLAGNSGWELYIPRIVCTEKGDIRHGRALRVYYRPDTNEFEVFALPGIAVKQHSGRRLPPGRVRAVLINEGRCHDVIPEEYRAA